MPERVIPEKWLTKAKIERVIIHWTAGAYVVSKKDQSHYHCILGLTDDRKDVYAVKGFHTPDDNDRTSDEDYAAHVAGLNTGSYGPSMACMAGAKEGGPYGKYPLTEVLWERAAQAAAEVLHAYGLECNERTCLFHSEVERVYGKDQNGKWDCDVLPYSSKLKPHEVHAQFRKKVSEWYLPRLKNAGAK